MMMQSSLLASLLVLSLCLATSAASIDCPFHQDNNSDKPAQPTSGARQISSFEAHFGQDLDKVRTTRTDPVPASSSSGDSSGKPDSTSRAYGNPQGGYSHVYGYPPPLQASYVPNGLGYRPLGGYGHAGPTYPAYSYAQGPAPLPGYPYLYPGYEFLDYKRPDYGLAKSDYGVARLEYPLRLPLRGFKKYRYGSSSSSNYLNKVAALAAADKAELYAVDESAGNSPSDKSSSSSSINSNSNSALDETISGEPSSGVELSSEPEFGALDPHDSRGLTRKSTESPSASNTETPVTMQPETTDQAITGGGDSEARASRLPIVDDLKVTLIPSAALDVSGSVSDTSVSTSSSATTSSTSTTPAPPSSSQASSDSSSSPPPSPLPSPAP